jgi:ATP synthase protein I
MADRQNDRPGTPQVQQAEQDLETFKREVRKREKRKLAMLQDGKESVWFGLGMFGLIGWSIVVPTLLGIAFGIWLDKRWQQGQVSWTLTFLVVGLCLGCLNAWFWIGREREAIYKKNENDDEEDAEKTKQHDQ